MYSTCCPQLPAPLSAKPQQPAALLQWHLPGAQTPGGTTRTLFWHGALRQLPRKTQLPAASSMACSPCALVTLMLIRMARSTLLSLTNCARTLPLCLVVSVWPQAGRRNMALLSAAQPPARQCLTCLTSARALLVGRLHRLLVMHFNARCFTVLFAVENFRWKLFFEEVNLAGVKHFPDFQPVDFNICTLIGESLVTRSKF